MFLILTSKHYLFIFRNFTKFQEKLFCRFGVIPQKHKMKMLAAQNCDNSLKLYFANVIFTTFESNPQTLSMGFKAMQTS